MTKEEFGKFAAALRTYYPREQILPNNQAVELWYQQLCDIAYPVAVTTLNKWVSVNKWSPSIADLREQSQIVMNGEQGNWSDGWGQLEHAIRYFGIYREDEAVDSLDDITKDTVKLLGFKNLCLSENQVADRANFRIVYEQIAERKKLDEQLPIGLKMAICNIRSEKQLQQSKEREKLMLGDKKNAYRRN